MGKDESSEYIITPEKLEELIKLCNESKTYTIPVGLTREERREFMRKCLSETHDEEE